jgi:phage/plasmid-associated DNA primase
LVESWRTDADSVAQFVEHKTKPVPLADSSNVSSTWGSATELYNLYSTFCSDMGHRRVSITKYGKRLKQLGYEQRRTSQGRFYSIRPLTLGESVFDWQGYKERMRQVGK